jgi:hypothetical protein
MNHYTISTHQPTRPHTRTEQHAGYNHDHKHFIGQTPKQTAATTAARVVLHVAKVTRPAGETGAVARARNTSATRAVHAVLAFCGRQHVHTFISDNDRSKPDPAT